MKQIAEVVCLALVLCACSDDLESRITRFPPPDGGQGGTRDAFTPTDLSTTSRFDSGIVTDSAVDNIDAQLDMALQPRDASPPVDPDMDVQQLPPDPMINSGWIGGPCVADQDCDYAEGFCLTGDEGYPRGMCSLDCDRLCPDRDELPVTFCVADVVAGGGACVQRCDYEAFGRTGCRPGYRCETRQRYGQADVGRGVCLPGTPDMSPNPMGECFEQLAALGVNFDLLAPVSDAVDGAPHLMCTISDNVRVHSPINGITFHYDRREAGSMMMSCELALVLHSLTQLLAEYNIQQVGHIGTYNCRGIRSNDGSINQISQHGLGTAIDLKWFRNAAGQEFNVFEHWEHGVTRNFQTVEGRWLYELGQEMHIRRLFNIILTPEYNAAHDDHFHLDLTEGANFIGHYDGRVGCGND
ncbi:MAG: extensin family protein [Bradymonadia bacterium]